MLHATIRSRWQMAGLLAALAVVPPLLQSLVQSAQREPGQPRATCSPEACTACGPGPLMRSTGGAAIPRSADKPD